MRLCMRLLVLCLLCGLGFMLGQRSASADIFIPQSSCELATCTSLVDETNSACTGVGDKCRFSNYGEGTMLYCDSPWQDTCRVPTPIVQNQCAGRCTSDEEIQCFKIAQKCKLFG